MLTGEETKLWGGEDMGYIWIRTEVFALGPDPNMPTLLSGSPVGKTSVVADSVDRT